MIMLRNVGHRLSRPDGDYAKVDQIQEGYSRIMLEDWLVEGIGLFSG